MELALVLPSAPDRKWKIAQQLGVEYAITSMERRGDGRPRWDFDSLVRLRTRFEDEGLRIAGFEGDLIGMQRIKLGLPGRDDDIELYCSVLRNMGAAGIPMVCYNFMARIGWYRTSTTTPERGGALTSSFDYELVKNAPLTEIGEVSEEKLWDNFTYFVQRVMPVAEKAEVRMALHPDDPPLSPLRGIGRILTNSDAFRRAMEIAPSEFNGITFCQANFKAMGEDIQELVREFGGQKKIFFVHFRDIKGTAEKFQETFHDNGPTSMVEMLKIYKEVGFDGPIRPDHVPSMEGEGNNSPGYEVMGRLFAVGYMKGIMETLDMFME